MIGLLQGTGEIVTNPAEADIIIVNTCAFIESATQESIDTILEMAEYKQKGKLKKLIVTGCMAQRYCDDVLGQFPEVDAVVGTAATMKLHRWCARCCGDSAVCTAAILIRKRQRGCRAYLLHRPTVRI